MMYQVLGFGTEHMTELAIVDTVEMIGPIAVSYTHLDVYKRQDTARGGAGAPSTAGSLRYGIAFSGKSLAVVVDRRPS